MHLVFAQASSYLYEKGGLICIWCIFLTSLRDDLLTFALLLSNISNIYALSPVNSAVQVLKVEWDN